MTWDRAKSICQKLSPFSRFFGQKIHEMVLFCFRYPSLCYFANSVLAGLCQYHNQTLSANQSIITYYCGERCQCHHINGTLITKCKPLCQIVTDPKCHPYSERLAEFQRSGNDTICTCTKKRCLAGIERCNILCCH